MNWIDKLNNFNENNIICVGIDPVFEKIKDLNLDLFDWSKLIIDLTAENCNVYNFEIEKGHTSITELYMSQQHHQLSSKNLHKQ